MRVKNKFYIGAHPLNTGWAKPTLVACVKQAEAILDAEPYREFVNIVQIIRVVRRAKSPKIVEVVK